MDEKVNPASGIPAQGTVPAPEENLDPASVENAEQGEVSQAGSEVNSVDQDRDSSVPAEDSQAPAEQSASADEPATAEESAPAEPTARSSPATTAQAASWPSTTPTWRCQRAPS